MAEYIEQIERLADCFRRLNGIGRKTALRMAFSVLEMDFRTEQDFRKAEDDCPESPAGFKIIVVSHDQWFYGST